MTRLLTALLAILALGLSGHAEATKRVALVIGNADYVQVGALDNPARDARAMGDVLRNVGFDVVQGIDLDRSGMQDALRVFAGKLESAEVALFYYAGHGIQVDGENYLIPIDAAIENETDLAFATVPLGLIEEQMSEVPRVKLIMLDACRDNPFKMDLMRSMSPNRSISVSDGLAPVSLADDVGGTFIAFATDPGAYASDGLGRDHAPFTQALLDNMSRPGMEIHEMMIDVRAQVWENTEQAQRPWSNSSLTGKFYFSEPKEEAPAPAVATPASDALVAAVEQADLELAFWQSISDGGSEAEYQAYLNKFPDGVFAEIARARITAGAAEQIAQAISPTSEVAPANDTIAATSTASELQPADVQHLPQLPETAPDVAAIPEPPAPETQSEQSAETGQTPEPSQSSDGSFEMAASAPPVNAPKVRDIRRRRDPQSTQTTTRNTSPTDRMRGYGTPVGGEDAMLLSAAERIAIERYLAALGMDPGEPDGIFDEDTRAAIRAWQWIEELPPTGFLTYKQIDLMRTHALTTAQNKVQPEPASLKKSAATTRRQTASWPSFETFSQETQVQQPPRQILFNIEPVDESLISRAFREIGENLLSDSDLPLTPQIDEQRRQDRLNTIKER